MHRILLAGLLIHAVAHSNPVVDAVPTYTEQFRPQYHFSPPRHWMNDPNGMVFLNGKYHLFYQHNPASSQWGPMHWGHAVSTDMVHWINRPIALYPDVTGTIFSGSVVYDRVNASGLGTTATPPLIAIFTSHNEALKQERGLGYQSQSLAYSVDEGDTWKKFTGNPVLQSANGTDFRDPKVFWNENTQRWIMTLAVGDHVSFYSSTDFKQWHYESDFGQGFGSHGGVWECPDLINMGTPGSSGSAYALLVSVGKGAPNGGSGTQYFIGNFDGHRFVPDEIPHASNPVSARWLDYGTDNYAGVSWSGVPSTDGRHLFMGWMSNWQYAGLVPTELWRGAMSLPRQLQFKDTPTGRLLISTPITELHSLRHSAVDIKTQTVANQLDLTQQLANNSGLYELELTIQTGAAKLITLLFDNSQHQSTRFRINLGTGQYELDRKKSGAVAFNGEFKKIQFAPILNKNGTVTLSVYVDWSSIEVFVNQGETVMSTVVFPTRPYSVIRLGADKPIKVLSGTLYCLSSIWKTI